MDDRRYLLRCKNYPTTTSGGDNNDSFDTATSIDFGEKIVGTLDKVDDDDFYYIDNLPRDYDAFTVIVDCDFSEFDGTYKCGFVIYDNLKNQVGVKRADYGEVAYLKVPIIEDGYYIKVVCFGDYVSSKPKKYHLETIGMECKHDSQTCLDAAIPIKVGDHFVSSTHRGESHYFSMFLEDSREITFVTQANVADNGFAIKIFDENKNLLAKTQEDTTSKLTYKLTKEKKYFIEVLSASDNEKYPSYLFYTEPYGVGGNSNTQNMELTFSSVRATINPPYTLGQKVLFNVTVKNNINRTVNARINAKMRDQNDSQGSGDDVSGDNITLGAKQERIVKIDVTMARTGCKDIVFEIEGSTVNKVRNCEIRGYTINEALTLVNKVEAFIQTKHTELNTPQLVLNATLTYFRSLIYDQAAFNFMLGNGNPEIARQVEQAFNGDNSINKIINGTILTDNNSRNIDFIHMIAVLEGCMDAAKSNKEKNSLCTGWLGDIASEGPNTVLWMTDTTAANLRTEALRSAEFAECSQRGSISCKASVKDLEADVDAVAIYKLYRDICAENGNTNITLYNLLSNYYKSYSEAYRNRYATFKQETLRICGANSFKRCVYNAVLGQYDTYAGFAIAILSKGTDPNIMIELGRLFTEYINTEGQTVRGKKLIQNDLWWK